MAEDAQQRDVTHKAPRSEARWYLWDGGFLAIGTSDGIIPPHSHHAIQLVIGISGEMAIRGTSGEWHDSRGIIVRQDAEHSYNGKGESGAMLFVDPESNEGVWLRTALLDDITLVPAARLEACVTALRTFNERPLESMAQQTTSNSLEH